MKLTLFSPAKINLFLRVLGRRPDRYHELATLMQAISLCDVIHFQLADEDHFSCDHPSLSQGQDNLILRALNLFRKKTNCSLRLKIHLEKKIPIQAGLGGGSSNAATTLWALNKLCGDIAALDELKKWSAEIGSDITFFLSNGTAFCTGRGEIIQDEVAHSPQAFWIVKPIGGLPTKKVFQYLNIHHLDKIDPAFLLQNFRLGSPVYHNDLENSAFLLMPELLQIKNKILSQGAKSVVMSGSGSSFFCVSDHSIELNDLFVCKTMCLNRMSQNWYSI